MHEHYRLFSNLFTCPLEKNSNSAVSVSHTEFQLSNCVTNNLKDHSKQGCVYKDKLVIGPQHAGGTSAATSPPVASSLPQTHYLLPPFSHRKNCHLFLSPPASSCLPENKHNLGMEKQGQKSLLIYGLPSFSLQMTPS